MALDEVLLRHATGPILRVYRWVRPALSFGYFGKFAPVKAAWPDREWVRRMTGGGVVPHGEDITYTVIAPMAEPLGSMSARESYQAVHARLADWLTRRGRASRLAEASPPTGNGVCFESPVEADVLADGRKLAGAAQRRTKEGLLLQGSIQGVPMAWGADLPALFGAAQRRGFTAGEMAEAEDLAAAKYGTQAWTERV